jgi:hypothetical protein
MPINTRKKRLAKIFGAYALTVSLLFGTGYGLQTAVNNLDKKPQASQKTEPQAQDSAARTPAKYFWLPATSKN